MTVRGGIKLAKISYIQMKQRLSALWSLNQGLHVETRCKHTQAELASSL